MRCRLLPATSLVLSACLAAAALAQGPGGPVPGNPGSTTPPPQPTPGRGPGGLPPIPVIPPPKPTAFQTAPDGAEALRAAKARAAERGTRVLVLWGPARYQWQEKLEWVMKTPGVAELVAREYEPIWIDVRDDRRGAAGRELARALDEGGADPAGDHARLTVLDAAGTLVAAASLEEMADEVRVGTYSPIKVELFLGEHKAPQPGAKDLLEASLAKARSEGKGVLLSISWAMRDWSIRFRDLLSKGPAGEIITRHFVLASVLMERNEGSGAMLEELGPKGLKDLPWFQALGADGRVMATSVPEGGENIGFPTDDKEIAHFVGMLRKAAPTMTDAEAKTVTDTLVAARRPRR